jgi:hypothetical protein
MRVKFINWSGDADANSNMMVAVRENMWDFEVDGSRHNWTIRHEEYLDEDGDGKSDGYHIFDNIADELRHDTRLVGWGDPNCEEIERPNHTSSDWTVGGMPGLDFVERVNQHFENGTVGWSLLDFPGAGYGVEDVLSGGEFEI